MFKKQNVDFMKDVIGTGMCGMCAWGGGGGGGIRGSVCVCFIPSLPLNSGQTALNGSECNCVQWTTGPHLLYPG